MNTRDKVRHVLGDLLLTEGWQHVFSEYSGVYQKGEFLFVLYHAKVKEDPPKQSAHCVVATTLITQDPVGVSWHLEHSGWLVAKGSIPSTIASAYDFDKGSHFYNEAAAFVQTNVFKYEAMSMQELNTYKSRDVLTIEQVYRDTLVPSTDSVRKTMLFKLSEPFEGVLHADTFYQIIDAKDGKLVVTEISKATLRAIGSLIFVSSSKELLALEASGILTPLAPGKGYCDTTAIQSIEKNAIGTQDLPDSFSDFELPKDKQTLVASAYNQCLNYTPLLTATDAMCGSKLLSLLEEGVTTEDLCGVRLDTEQLGVLGTIHSAGFPLKPFVHDDYSAEYLKVLYSDKSKAVGVMTDRLKSEGYNSEVALRVAMLWLQDPSALTLMDSDMMSTYEADLRVFKSKPGFEFIADYLLKNGVPGPSFYFANLDTNSAETKAFFRKYLAADGLRFQDGEWSDFVENALAGGLRIVFSHKEGFMLGCSQYYVGRDFNSLVIYNAGLHPVWNAVRVNGRFFVNEKEERNIYV